MINKLKKMKWMFHTVFLKPNDFNVPILKRIKGALHYFSPNEVYWFQLDDSNYQEYISDYERVLSRKMNPDQKIILDDKLIFEEIFRKYVRVPENYGCIANNQIYGLHGNHIDNENIISFIVEKGAIVVKWTKGYEGKGTFIIVYNQGEFKVNGISTSVDELKKMLLSNNDAIICEYMVQSAFEKSLYPFSTNTIRIICAKEKNQREARVIKAAQRIGNAKSAPVDNVSAGAISCEIKIDTGEMMQGVIAKAHQKNGGSKFLDVHPDTGVQLAGLKIPNWEKIKEEIENLTNIFPYLNFVAWDVLLTDEGICLIEGNASSGLMMFQQRHGVRKEEIGDIYRSYGIIE